MPINNTFETSTVAIVSIASMVPGIPPSSPGRRIWLVFLGIATNRGSGGGVVMHVQPLGHQKCPKACIFREKNTIHPIPGTAHLTW